MKKTRCLGCLAYSVTAFPFGYPNCLLKEDMSCHRNKFGHMVAWAVKPYCKCKTIKEYLRRVKTKYNEKRLTYK